MSDYILQSLYRQRSNVNTGMTNVRSNISGLESKISRLDRALTTLGNKMNELEVMKRRIDQFNINGNEWRGNESDRFERKCDIYKHSKAQYYHKVVDASKLIADEKSRLESSLDNAEIHLARLTNSLNTLNNQISQTRRV